MQLDVRRSPLCVAVYFWVFIFHLGQHLADGCRGGQSQQQEFGRHSRAHEGSSTTITRYSVHKINSEDSVYATKSIRARQGDQIYARVFVPYYRGDTNDWTLTLIASWTKRYQTTPLWLFIKKTGLPTTTSYDKTSISFVSRKFSRIRLEGATPGPYFVMVEALTDLSNVTLSVTVTPTSSLVDEDDFVRIEDNNINNSHDAVP